MHAQPMADEVLIYVELLGEGVEVWRPVAVTVERPGVYRLPADQPADETWAFRPGSRVHCEMRVLEGTEQLVAVAAG
jgi:hypothetical protein